ncbi:MAG: sodium-dependent bicarbonate transport family permease, partial [Cytophagales bacterium]
YVANQGIPAGGYMVAGMAIMESPAIIMGLLLIRMSIKTETSVLKDGSHHDSSLKSVVKEAVFNGSIVLLVGSLVIGYLAGDNGEKELHGFVKDIFKGMLALYLLDMGLVAGSRMSALKKSGFFLVAFAIITPLINAALGIGIAYVLGFSVGDAFLFTILCASASYIAVPAAMRMAVPQANMSLLLPMALAVTFPFNIILGIPVYLMIIKSIWGV